MTLLNGLGYVLADYNLPPDAVPVASLPASMIGGSGGVTALVSGGGGTGGCNQIGNPGCNATTGAGCTASPAQPFYSPSTGQYFCGPMSGSYTASAASPIATSVTTPGILLDVAAAAGMLGITQTDLIIGGIAIAVVLLLVTIK